MVASERTPRVTAVLRSEESVKSLETVRFAELRDRIRHQLAREEAAD
jgi:hypothetical protein